jgi:hypothetical protein
VRMVETGMFRVYMVWISGAWMSCASRQPGSPVVPYSTNWIPPALSRLLLVGSQGIRTARSQSRYELSTRFDASSQFAARRGVSAQWPHMSIVGASVHWRVRCARYVGLIIVAVCLACPPMPPVSRAMKHSRCAVAAE